MNEPTNQNTLHHNTSRRRYSSGRVREVPSLQLGNTVSERFVDWNINNVNEWRLMPASVRSSLQRSVVVGGTLYYDRAPDGIKSKIFSITKQLQMSTFLDS